MDQAGVTNLYAYNDAGSLIAVTNAPVPNPEQAYTSVSPVTQYEYDAYGRLRLTSDAKQRVTTNTYDFAARLLTRSLPMGQTETNVYNANGQLCVTNFFGVVLLSKLAS